MTAIRFDKIENEQTRANGLSLSVARFDLIHETVSGNKLFKLHFFIEECLATEHRTLLTFGGAYSNHLAATAFLCREKRIRAIAVVRGEEPAVLSPTLLRCRELGMLLHFVSRQDYTRLNTGNTDELQRILGPFTAVPEGGYSPAGAAGAALMHELIDHHEPTHICTAAGTATTVAGLMMKQKTGQEIIAVPVIKNMTDLSLRIEYLLGENRMPAVFDGYSFGGYAKYDAELIQFMNCFYNESGIPTDFVYTAKLMYAVTDQIKKGYFKKGSRIICLHTGGLQGNLSLPPGTLNF